MSLWDETRYRKNFGDRPIHRATLHDMAHQAEAARRAHNEATVRYLLSFWVSELEPTVAYFEGRVVGLAHENTLVLIA